MRWKMLTIAVGLVVSIAAVSNSDPLGYDPGLSDTVVVDSVVAYVTDPGIVPIYFYNDEALAGVEVTMIYDSPDVTVDSFSFVGGRADYVSLKGILTGPNTVTVYCFPFSGELLISPGNGLLGQLYFSYLPTISPQVVTLDTTTIAVDNKEYSTTFSDSIANAFRPQFQKGYLDIQENPSCCVGNRGNVDNDPDDLVNVADLTYLVAYLFQGGPEPVCTPEGNVDGDTGEQINVADLTYLVSYLFQGGPLPPPCF